ncbi:hypothetical protein ACOSQ3_010451 [Xanthoceras sorbifolium]
MLHTLKNIALQRVFWRRKLKLIKNVLLVLNYCILLTLGQCSSPLLGRLYFIHGGRRVWLSSWLLTAAWPVILLPITVTYLRCCHISPAKFFFIKPPVFIAAAIIGVITGFNNYLYTYGQACLPVSTTSLIIATSLAFTAGFAFLLVMQKFTSYSINAVVLLTIGAGVLALDTSSDRPKNESQRVHARIFHDAGSISLYGFVLPLVDYTLVMEIQMVMCLFATLFCTAGILVNNDFMVILLPITEILGVIFFHEKFQAEKGVALGLSLGLCYIFLW